jgi:hypothetical protein
MPCSKDRSRVAQNGRAYAGSQRQIQTYVNLQTDTLSASIIKALSLTENSRIVWVSPLASDSYNEYRDSEFLHVLGLTRLTPMLVKFWPRGGPCWDALARIERDGRIVGCILVEAKSHILEICGSGCGAKGASLKRILEALAETKKWLGVTQQTPWTGTLYQSANRYAHLHFLRAIAGIDAYLVNIYFVNDPHSPTTVEEWKPAIHDVQRQLGLVASVPFTAEVFLNGLR